MYSKPRIQDRNPAWVQQQGRSNAQHAFNEGTDRASHTSAVLKVKGSYRDQRHMGSWQPTLHKNDVDRRSTRIATSGQDDRYMVQCQPRIRTWTKEQRPPNTLAILQQGRTHGPMSEQVQQLLTTQDEKQGTPTWSNVRTGPTG